MTLRVRLLASGAGDPGGSQYATTFLVNGVLAVDAGSLGYCSDLAVQRGVRDVVVTHSHADHVASLPVFLENVGRPEGPPVTVWATAPVLESLRGDVFNGRVWPDLERLFEGRLVRFRTLEPEQPVTLGELTVTPVDVDHCVPTSGVFVSDGGSTVLIASDTGDTERIWELANRRGDVAGLFLESSLPDARAELAEVSGHLTPAVFARQLAKLDTLPRTYAVHIKPAFRETVLAELAALEVPGLEVAVPDEEYRFP